MLSNMGALIKLDPAAAKAKIVAAFRQAEGNRTRAAKVLDVSERNFYRWVEKLGMWDELDGIVRANGWQVQHGPPRTRDRVLAEVVKAGGDLPRASRSLGLTEADLRSKISELGIEDQVRQVGGVL